MTTELWPVNRLQAYKRNPRKNDHAIDKMVASIQQFGFKVPLLITGQGELIDGHLRLKAALQLGMTELPAVVCDDWTPAQVQAFRLMVNRSVSWAEWDDELLAIEFSELRGFNFDLAFTGFDAPEIDGLLFPAIDEELVQIAAEPPSNPVTRLGDLWLCGPHRILCGDSTSADSVAQVLEARRPNLMVIDPPYGVRYEPKWREEAGLGRPRQRGTVPNDHLVDWTASYQLFPGDVAYVWHAGVHSVAVAAGLESAGFDIRAQVIWAKQHFVLGRGDYHWQHEPCWYAVRQGRASHWRGDRTQSTLWQVANLSPIGGNTDEGVTGHPTQKPIELMRRPILNHTERGAFVYDAFLGSGTTLVAAEMTERICLGMDIDAGFVDVAVERWQRCTGRAAVLASSAHTFEEIKKERLGGLAEAVQRDGAAVQEGNDGAPTFCS